SVPAPDIDVPRPTALGAPPEGTGRAPEIAPGVHANGPAREAPPRAQPRPRKRIQGWLLATAAAVGCGAYFVPVPEPLNEIGWFRFTAERSGHLSEDFRRLAAPEASASEPPTASSLALHAPPSAVGPAPASSTVRPQA